MMPTGNEWHIPAVYTDFVKIFSQPKAETIPPLRSTGHAIDWECCYILPYGPIYNLLEYKSRMLMTHIEANLANRFIQ